MSTAITKPPPTSECDSSEESGWTKYFDDFLNNHHIDDDHKCCSVSFSGVDSYSTLFACAAQKMLNDTKPQESCFRKRKKVKTASVVDDALEDTATSPVKASEEKGNTPRKRDENQELGFRRDNDHTELKKKGLCLVPLSMIAKYLG